MNPPNENRSEVSDAIEEARSVTREQVAAMWQMHLDRVREQLENGWQDSLQRVVDERFSEVEQRLQTGFRSALAASRRQFTGTLNTVARRLRQAGNLDEAVRALLDGAAEFSEKSALFSVTAGGLRLEGDSSEVIP